MKWPLALLAIACCALTGLLVTLWQTPSIDVIIVIISTLVAAIPLILAIIEHRFDVFEPVYLFAAAYSVLFVIRPIFDLTTPGALFVEGHNLHLVYANALVLASLGALGFYVGYYTSAGKRLAGHIPSPVNTLSASSLNAAVIVAAVICGISFILFIVQAGGSGVLRTILAGRNIASADVYRSANGYLYSAPLFLAPIAVLMLAIVKSWRSRQAIMAFVLLLASQVTTLSSGARSWTLPVTFAVLILWYLRRQQRPRLPMILLTMFVLFLLGVAVPLAVRNTATVTGTPDRQTVATTVVRNPLDAIKNFFTTPDTAMLANFAAELQVTPSVIGWGLGRGYLYAAARPIPHAVWQSKRQNLDDEVMSAAFPRLARAKVGYAFSIFGEPYHEFGFFGVFLVLFVVGILWRALYEWFRRDPTNACVIALYAINWPFLFVYMRGSLGIDYQRQLMSMLPIVAMILICRNSVRREDLVAGTRGKSIEHVALRGRVSAR